MLCYCYSKCKPYTYATVC